MNERLFQATRPIEHEQYNAKTIKKDIKNLRSLNNKSKTKLL